MSVRSGSSSIETTRPIKLMWLYQFRSSSTVSAARGSRRRNRRRRRLSSMFSSTRPSSQSHQVGTVCGDPSGRSVAMTAGFGRDRNSSTSGGTGTGGTRESLRRRDRRRELGFGWLDGLNSEFAHVAYRDHDQGRHNDPDDTDPERR